MTDSGTTVFFFGRVGGVKNMVVRTVVMVDNILTNRVAQRIVECSRHGWVGPSVRCLKRLDFNWIHHIISLRCNLRATVIVVPQIHRTAGKRVAIFGGPTCAENRQHIVEPVVRADWHRVEHGADGRLVVQLRPKGQLNAKLR